MKHEKLTYLKDYKRLTIGWLSNLTARRSSLVLLLILSSFLAGAAEVDAGEDIEACPGEEVVIGGDPTASPGPETKYKYSWTASDGSFTSDKANPTVTVQDQVVTYTVVVEDEDGFKCDDSMTITPNDVIEIQFDPEKLPNDGTSTATAKAITVPDGLDVEWSLVDDDFGASIDPNTGVITAGEEPGYLMVRAQEQKAADDGIDGCYVEAPFCVGEDCCPDITELRTFGPITANFSEPVVSPGKDQEGYCSYSTSNASITIESTSLFQYKVDLTGVTISWKEKATQSGTEYKEVEIVWKGSKSTREIGKLQANLTEVGLKVSNTGRIEGEIKFSVNQTEDVKLGGIAVLRGGATGKFVYRYSSQETFAGEWDFSDVTGIKIDLYKEDQVLARASGKLTKEGAFEGTLKDNGPIEYSAEQFSARVKKLSVGFRWELGEELQIKKGTGELEIFGIKAVDGKILMALDFDGANITATTQMQGVTAFGCELSGTVTGDMDIKFDFGPIIGSNISAKHPEFDQSFNNVGFEIAEGRLQRFDVGSVRVKYNSGLYFDMMDASYDGNKSIEFNANLVAGGLDVEVKRFAIDSSGDVTIGEAKLKVDDKPFNNINASLVYKKNEAAQMFRGQFRGNFTGGVKVLGTATIGSEANFNYGYFAVALDAGRQGFFIIPGTPLKVTELGGEFGYNWIPAGSLGTISGTAKEGEVLVGVKLGVGDVTNLAVLTGELRVSLGAASKVNINGSVNIPARSPYYLDGDAAVEYILGSGNLGGSVSSTVKFPRGKGTVLLLESGNINFDIGKNDEYAVTAASMKGKIFEKIKLTGDIDISGPLNSVFDLSGSVSGSVEYSDTFDYTFPKDFNPTTCKTADGSDFFGFGITGQLQVELGGDITANLDNEGITGTFGVYASGQSDMSVKWPCKVVCGQECVKTYDTGVAGELTVQYKNPEIRIFGEATFTSGDESEKGDVDFTF